MTSLSTLVDGSLAILAQLTGERSFRRRLMELGLLPGTPIRLVRRNEVAGVLEVEVRNCRLALRSTEAAAMLVTSC